MIQLCLMKIRRKRGERSRLIRELDKIFSEFIRERDSWQCQRCRRYFGNDRGRIHCAHIFSRGKMATRYSGENALALCKGCHKFWAHVHTDDFRDFNIERLGEQRYGALRLRSNMLWRLYLPDLRVLMGKVSTPQGRDEIFNR